MKIAKAGTEKKWHRSPLLAAVITCAATAAQTHSLPERLQRATDCMVRVLTTTRGVSNPRIDIDTKGEAVCLAFKPDEKNVWDSGLMQFCLDKNFTSNKPYNFTGIIPGIVSSPDEEPDNHVTDAVVTRWNKQCRVSVLAFYA